MQESFFVWLRGWNAKLFVFLFGKNGRESENCFRPTFEWVIYFDGFVIMLCVFCQKKLSLYRVSDNEWVFFNDHRAKLIWKWNFCLYKFERHEHKLRPINTVHETRTLVTEQRYVETLQPYYYNSFG